MNTDLMLVAGLLLVILCVPAVISAFSSDGSLRGSVALGASGAALILAAWTIKPEGYRPQDVPHVVLSVIADFIR